MHIVPLRLTRRDDRREALLERGFGEGGDLDGALVDGPAALAVDCGRGDDGGADGGGEVRGEDDLVDVAVDGLVGEAEQAVDVADVVVVLLREGGLAVAFVLLVVLSAPCVLDKTTGRKGYCSYPLQNSRARDVKPEAGLLRSVALGETLRDGLR